MSLLWIIIIVVVVGWIVLALRRKSLTIQKMGSEINDAELENTTEEIRDEITRRASVPNLPKIFFTIMEDNYLRCCERFKHQSDKLIQVKKDWLDYCKIILQWSRPTSADYDTYDDSTDYADSDDYKETKKLNIKN